jgi:hypothetical protein
MTRKGFSFAEVMFAVVILGIGFIMIAAIFPVAIQQSQLTGEESMGAAAAREASNALQQVPASVPFIPRNLPPNPPTPAPNNYQWNPSPLTSGGSALLAANYYPITLFPPTTKEINFNTPTVPPGGIPSPLPPSGQFAPEPLVAPLYGSRWEMLRGNLMLPSDERFAWIPFYQRASGTSLMRVFVFAVQARNRSIYDRAKDLEPPLKQLQAYNNGGIPSNLSATFIRNNRVNTTYAPTGTAYPPGTAYYPDFVTLNNYSGQTPAEGLEGWCIRVQSTGRTYRLGQQINGGVPNNTSKRFILSEPDDLRVAAGADGTWGTPDDVFDDPARLNNIAMKVDLIPPATFQPRMCRVSLQYKASGAIAGRITFYNPTGISQPLGPPPVPDTPGLLTTTAVASNRWVQPEAAPGAFVVICDDMASDQLPVNLGTKYTHYAGVANGRVYRLGAPVSVTDPSTGTTYPAWDLDPVAGMRSSAEDLPRQLVTPPGTLDPLPRAYIISGAGQTDPQDMFNGTATLIPQTSGVAQDVSYFTTFVAVQ